MKNINLHENAKKIKKDLKIHYPKTPKQMIAETSGLAPFDSEKLALS